MAAAVLPISYLYEVIAEQKDDLVSKWQWTGQICKEVPDVRPSSVVIMPFHIDQL